ncbi:hypothetical protein [Brevundimonas denitrificans]|uniref:[protein-PII] uridylyltransferase family protein n=1 Tax=Brevundimonas denitrificans TaxID=1443434 RepID=UPI00223ADA21|nr:hypothetical protein [Brevundimonas denitrificans]
MLGAEALEGLLTGRERRTFEESFDFLWRVRHHLHRAAGRAEEKLTFDLQPEVARRMGWQGRGDEPAVERFMRRYFLVARDVGGLTRALSAKLEERGQKRALSLTRLIPRRRRQLGEPGFVEDHGRLSITAPDVFEAEPLRLLTLFQLADRHDLDLHPDAFSAVTRSLNLVTPKLRRDPAASAAFLDILADGDRPYRVLTLMNETGLLGRPAGMGPHRRPDPVQHVPRLYGGRAHPAGHRHHQRHCAGQAEGRPSHVVQHHRPDPRPAGADAGHAAARRGQGRRPGPA